MITMLTDRLLRRAREGGAAPPSWRLNLMVASMPPRDPAYPSVFGLPPDERMDFPCISVMGAPPPYSARRALVTAQLDAGLVMGHC